MEHDGGRDLTDERAAFFLAGAQFGGTLPDLFLQYILGLAQAMFCLLEVSENEIEGRLEPGYKYCPVDKVVSRQFEKVANQVGGSIDVHIGGERHFGKGRAGY